MAVSLFTRFVKFHRFSSINNDTIKIWSYPSQPLSMSSILHLNIIDKPEDNSEIISNKTTKKINIAAKTYIEKNKAFQAFMEKQIAEYEIGKRHLANIMGEDPDNFTKDDIKRSIEYLFPSGLFEPKARPLMKPPQEIFPGRKEAEFDITGRPFHSMFYTIQPNFYNSLYDILHEYKKIQNIEFSKMNAGLLSTKTDKLNLLGKRWLSKAEVEELLIEKMSDNNYSYLIKSLERLADHPFSNHAQNIIFKFSKELVAYSSTTELLPIQYTEDGRPYVHVPLCQRKRATATVTVLGGGSGKITINGSDITYFADTQPREQG